MQPDFSPLKLIRLTKEYIEQNKEPLFCDWRSAWDNSYWGEQTGFDVKEETAYTVNLAEVGSSYALANEENKLVAFGMITVENFAPPKSDEEEKLYKELHDKYSPIAYIHELVIAKELRGKGYGSKLLDLLLNIVEEKGCQAVLLWTEYNSDSKYLYKSKGFTSIFETTVNKPKHPSGKEHRLFMLKEFRD